MDINIDKALIKVIRTGKVVIGSKKSFDVATSGEAKMVVLASNCPPAIREQIESTDVTVLNYSGTNMDLGPVCGKPFVISALAIIEPGESDILSIA